MIKQNRRTGENLPSVDLLDLQGRKADITKWKGVWTLFVFLRHLG